MHSVTACFCRSLVTSFLIMFQFSRSCFLFITVFLASVSTLWIDLFLSYSFSYSRSFPSDEFYIFCIPRSIPRDLAVYLCKSYFKPALFGVELLPLDSRLLFALEMKALVGLLWIRICLPAKGGLFYSFRTSLVRLPRTEFFILQA